MKLLLGFLVLFAASSVIQCVHWETAQNGTIPELAIKFKHSYTDYTTTIYCRTKDEETGILHSGIMHEGETACEYPRVKQDSVAYSRQYEVLCLDEQKDRIHFRYRQQGEPLPPGAVKCHDDEISNCYFGRSMYSDGICDEELGKIDIDSRLIYVAATKEVHKCPFFLYLTDTGSVQRDGHHVYPQEFYNRFLQY